MFPYHATSSYCFIKLLLHPTTTLSPCPIALACCLDLLPCHIVLTYYLLATLPPHYFITLPYCCVLHFLIAFPHRHLVHYFIALSLPYHVTLLPCLVALSHYFITLVRCLMFHHVAIAHCFIGLLHYLVAFRYLLTPPICCFATLLPCALLFRCFVALCWLVLPFSILFCREELEA
jgi:hypothetical protein